jgi:uncharacterized DUF497 family protein
MLDLSQVVGFDWDDGNRRKSADKHDVGQMEAEHVFLDPRLLVLLDEKHSAQETRDHAYGSTAAGRLLEVSFTMRQNETLVRVISVRAMSRKERSRYEEQT